jgi:EmrB/QacA subfamily drug resistance transporter
MSEAIAPAETTKQSPGAVMSQRQIMVSFVGLMLVMLLAALDQTIVSTALYTILGDIGGKDGLSHLSWVVTAYLLTSTATTLVYGKISDLIGRKSVLMFAIIVFLGGSALCGLSHDMTQLILFRGIQGIGAGGLMSLTFAAIADMVSPRERGKYQGYFGGVFALAMVAGPLIGGFFSDQPHILGITGWRWVFYVNVPIGILALIVISSTMHLVRRKTEHNIDYTGASLMVIGVCALLMVSEWAGQEYAWGSPTIIGLIIGGVVFLTAFVLWERRAPEPVMPMHLFRGSIFSISNAIRFIIGLALTGSVIYVSIYMQMVNGDTPTQAGLSLLPMMAGLLGASLISGQIVSRTGKYKLFPIVGTAIGVVGMLLMSRLNEHTSLLDRSFYMLVLGIGIGLTMQVVVVAMQNSVPMREMGIATSASTFFQSMGGAFGTAIFGAILTTSLNHHVTHAMGGKATKINGTPNPIEIRRLPAATQHIVVHSFVQAMSLVFVVAAVIVAFAFVLSLFLKQIELRRSNSHQRPNSTAAEGAGGAGPEGDDQNDEIAAPTHV